MAELPILSGRENDSSVLCVCCDVGGNSSGPYH
jgi:hypothetical protein